MSSIVEMIARHAERKPDYTAIIAEEQSIAYGPLYERIRAFRDYLAENGVRRGDRVIVKASHTIAYAVACYGVHLAGAVLVPVEKNLPVKGVAELARETDAVMVVSDADPDDGRLFLDMKRVTEVSEPRGDLAPVTFPDEDMTADILFTTGTTGKSKGVQLSHLSILTMARTSIEGTQMAPDNVYLVTVPMNHAGGIRKLHMTMYNGSTIVLLDSLMRVKQFFQYMDQYGVTSIYLPPSAVRMLIQLTGKEMTKYDHQLRFIYTGSAAYPETDKEKLCALLPDVRLYNGYGGSEIGSVSMLDYNAHKGLVGCIGVPNSAVQVKIVDEDRNEIQSDADHVGLLAVHSDMNMQCYWHEPELTAETMADGWIYTSDLGYFDENGMIFLVGRSGDVINVGGLKVAPTEVEEAALRHESVADCVCTSADDKRMGKVVKLLVVVKDGCAFDPADIQNMLRGYLEAYKVPKYVEQIDEVPRTYNGKIDRKRLPK